jgi:hypothetical protein
MSAYLDKQKWTGEKSRFLKCTNYICSFPRKISNIKELKDHYRPSEDLSTAVLIVWKFPTFFQALACKDFFVKADIETSFTFSLVQEGSERSLQQFPVIINGELNNLEKLMSDFEVLSIESKESNPSTWHFNSAQAAMKFTNYINNSVFIVNTKNLENEEDFKNYYNPESVKKWEDYKEYPTQWTFKTKDEALGFFSHVKDFSEMKNVAVNASLPPRDLSPIPIERSEYGKTPPEILFEHREPPPPPPCTICFNSLKHEKKEIGRGAFGIYLISLHIQVLSTKEVLMWLLNT